MAQEFERFAAKIYKIGNSLAITVPDAICRYAGYKEGDQLKVMTKKEG